MNQAKQTTAALRDQAWQAEKACDWSKAALDAYPDTRPKSQLAAADREHLRRKARRCRTLVVHTERLCEVTA